MCTPRAFHCGVPADAALLAYTATQHSAPTRQLARRTLPPGARRCGASRNWTRGCWSSCEAPVEADEVTQHCRRLAAFPFGAHSPFLCVADVDAQWLSRWPAARGWRPVVCGGWPPAWWPRRGPSSWRWWRMVALPMALAVSNCPWWWSLAINCSSSVTWY